MARFPTGSRFAGVVDVDVSSVVYAALLVCSLGDAHDAADPLYRLNTLRRVGDKISSCF